MVEDVLVDDLRRTSPEPMVYLPGASTSPAYVMKSARADQLAPEVRAIVREMIPNSPMYRIFTMEALAAKAMASLSFTMVMVSIAAVLALVLGAVGLYVVLVRSDATDGNRRTHGPGRRGQEYAGCSSGKAPGLRSLAWSWECWRR